MRNLVIIFSTTLIGAFLGYQFGIQNGPARNSVSKKMIPKSNPVTFDNDPEPIKKEIAQALVVQNSPSQTKKPRALLKTESIATTEKQDSILEKKRRLKKMKNYIPDHPGRTEELKAGTEHPDGTLVGQVEAQLFFEVFEQDLAESLADMDPEELKNKFAIELSWFQRVGNFRKSQKCEALQKMQKSFGLPQTSKKLCVANIMETEKETWNL